MRLLSRSPRRALVAATVAGLLLAGSVATLPSYAASDEPSGDAPTGAAVTDPIVPVDPGTPGEVAEDSLAAAEELVAGDATSDPTLVLNQLSATLEDLPASDERRAERILARPTDGGDPEDVLLTYGVAEATPHCSGHVCVHYVTTTRHAPDPTSTDGDAIPDYVQLTATVLNTVWDTEISGLDYRAPVPDRGTAPAGTANDEGPDTRLDVYLGDIGRDGYYGYAATDRTSPRTSSAYLVLDDDFEDFTGPATPKELLRVTTAHEFFHVVQFGYDQYEDGWFMEATATWMEERVYDAVNDNRQYLPASSLALPGRSLDYPLTTSTAYGNWVFFEFVSERMGVDRIRGMWTRAAKPGNHSMIAVSGVLRAGGTDLTELFTGFAAGNLFPAKTYDEGSRFRTHAPVSSTTTLTSRTPGTGTRRVRLDHLTSRSYAFTAGASLTGSRRVKLTVNGPSSYAGAVAIIVRKDGSITRRPMALNSHGNGVLRVPISRSAIRRVTLTLANTSARYTCGAGVFTCNGKPRHQNRMFSYSARAIR